MESRIEELNNYFEQVKNNFEMFDVKRDLFENDAIFIYFKISNIPNWLFVITTEYSHLYKDSTICFYGEHLAIIDKFRPSDVSFVFFNKCFDIGILQIKDIIKHRELEENYTNFFETDYNKDWIHNEILKNQLEITRRLK